MITVYRWTDWHGMTTWDFSEEGLALYRKKNVDQTHAQWPESRRYIVQPIEVRSFADAEALAEFLNGMEYPQPVVNEAIPDDFIDGRDQIDEVTA